MNTTQNFVAIMDRIEAITEALAIYEYDSIDGWDRLIYDPRLNGCADPIELKAERAKLKELITQQAYCNDLDGQCGLIQYDKDFAELNSGTKP